MFILQTDKLKKILALTTSNNDNEVLVAIKQANRILQEANKTWSEVFDMDLTEANNRYEQLRLNHIALINNYNQLLTRIAVQTIPQRSTPRRRTRRF